MNLSFANLKVRTKLLLSFCLVAVMSLLVAMVGIFNITQLQRMDNELYNRQTVPLLELRIINGCFEQNRAYMKDIILENDPAKVSVYINAIDENSKKINEALAKFSQSLVTAPEKREFEYFSNVLENFGYHRDQFIFLCKNGNKAFAQTVMMNDGPKLSVNFNKAIDNLSKMKETTGKNTASTNENRAQASVRIMGALLFAACVLAIGLGIIISSMIGNPLTAIASEVSKLSQGNLNCKIPSQYISSNDELGQLGTQFNKMAVNLKSIISQVRTSSEQVAGSAEELNAGIAESAQVSEQISGNIGEIAAGAENQLSTLTHTVAMVNKMSGGINEIINNTNTAKVTAEKASASAKEGEEEVEQVISKMNDIKTSVSNSAAVVTELGNRSKEIGQIVSTISSIASQTNLLALNAAIEAARAGEQGRGFAVVAEEVRKLAEQCQDAAKQITSLVTSIQKDTSEAVTAMAHGSQEVNIGAQVVNDTGDSFKKVAAFVLEMSGQIEKISTVVDQITHYNHQVVQSVHESEAISRNTSSVTQTVSAATEEQSATMAEMAKSSVGLGKLAEQLQELVKQFKL